MLEFSTLNFAASILLFITNPFVFRSTYNFHSVILSFIILTKSGKCSGALCNS